jgi:transposase
MTFIKKIKKKSGIYLAEVEGKWINGKSVHKHIRYIGVVPTINEKITSKSDRKKIRDLEIVQKLLDGKSKKDLSILYEVNIKTIENIKKRFDKEGVNGLIQTRKSNSKTVKVSNSEEAKLITEYVKNPTDDLNKLKESVKTKLSTNKIKKIIEPIKESLKVKKKILLEIN